LVFHFDIYQWCPICMIQQAYECIAVKLVESGKELVAMGTELL